MSSPAEWNAYIRNAANSAEAGDRMEEAVAAGVDFAAMIVEQDSRTFEPTRAQDDAAEDLAEVYHSVEVTPPTYETGPVRTRLYRNGEHVYSLVILSNGDLR